MLLTRHDSESSHCDGGHFKFSLCVMAFKKVLKIPNPLKYTMNFQNAEFEFTMLRD